MGFAGKRHPRPPIVAYTSIAPDKLDIHSYSAQNFIITVPLRALQVMNRFRTPLSVLVAWLMIALAVVAGMPSTGCLCANGQFKFFCGHQHRVDPAHGENATVGCCADHLAAIDCDRCLAAPAAKHDGDCCKHAASLPGNGVRSRSCCQPVFNAAGISPTKVSAPRDDSSRLGPCLVEADASAFPAVAADIDELDTGPPIDRVVAFRHLLI